MPRGRRGGRTARHRRHHHGRRLHGIHHHGIAHHRMNHRRMNHRRGARHVTFAPNLTALEKHELYKQNLIQMIAEEKVAAGLNPSDPACQAISIAALSHNDEIISSLTQFDRNAIRWQCPLVDISVELNEQKASWTAGTQLFGVVKMISAQVCIPFPSQALTIQLLGMEESHFGEDEAGRAEIINLTFPITTWNQ